MDSLTTDQILAHREERKKSGLIGCIDGSDMPLQSLRGISWRPADPTNPNCFCHDCRNSWDKTGEIDLELIRRGDKRARLVYASILPNKKDTFRELRRKTDDALEEFVKAQCILEEMMKNLDELKKALEKKIAKYSDLTENRSAEYLKDHESEIYFMADIVHNYRDDVKKYEKLVAEAEQACDELGDRLMDARTIERDFLDTNF